jgi:hypothetical protein
VERLYRIAGLLLLALLLAGCADSAVPASIECNTAYRPTVFDEIEQEDNLPITLEISQATLTYPDLVFAISYYRKGPDGPPEMSISVSATQEGSDTNLAAAIYQQSQLTSQPGGMHGFTGLQYVYHPVTRAELQYWCEVRS